MGVVVSSDLQRLLAALASPIRRQILWLVWDEPIAAGTIASAFTLSAPTISEHLAVLRDAGLVTIQVNGSYRRYRANQPALLALHDLVLDEQQQARATQQA